MQAPNQTLEQTRDSVLRYGEVIGRELLNFFVMNLTEHQESRDPSASVAQQWLAALRHAIDSPRSGSLANA